MIRKNPSGDLPTIHPTAILCGLVVVEANVFIGFNSVLFNCTVSDGCVARTNNRLVQGYKAIQNESDRYA